MRRIVSENDDGVVEAPLRLYKGILSQVDVAWYGGLPLDLVKPDRVHLGGHTGHDVKLRSYHGTVCGGKPRSFARRGRSAISGSLGERHGVTASIFLVISFLIASVALKRVMSRPLVAARSWVPQLQPLRFLVSNVDAMAVSMGTAASDTAPDAEAKVEALWPPPVL
jgi:hypothetical protein